MSDIASYHGWAPPVLEGRWLRPARTAPAEPRWGLEHGIQVGLAPLPGPRGLLRVYTPYLDQARDRLLNFVAVEPVVAGEHERGYSELEHSELDAVQGKRFWATDEPDPEPSPYPSSEVVPPAGQIDVIDGIEHLTVFVMCERFANGAHVYLRLRLREDRPYELAIATYRHPDSAPLDRCIVTATMGNFARLRRLELRDDVHTPASLWPGFAGPQFTDHARFGLASLRRGDAGEAVVSAVPDELVPTDAAYAEGTAEHWRYVGRRARQSWVAEDPDPELEVLVNARATYWASSSPIPGGPSYENFELTEPFRQGRELRFRVEPLADQPPTH